MSGLYEQTHNRVRIANTVLYVKTIKSLVTVNTKIDITMYSIILLLLLKLSNVSTYIVN